jgi:hypothetical protein
MYSLMRFVFVYVDGFEVEVIKPNAEAEDILTLLLLTRIIKNRHCRKSVIGLFEPEVWKIPKQSGRLTQIKMFNF